MANAASFIVMSTPISEPLAGTTGEFNTFAGMPKLSWKYYPPKAEIESVQCEYSSGKQTPQIIYKFTTVSNLGSSFGVFEEKMTHLLQQGRLTLKPTKMPDTDEAIFNCKFKSEGSVKTFDSVLYTQRTSGNLYIYL